MPPIFQNSSRVQIAKKNMPGDRDLTTAKEEHHSLGPGTMIRQEKKSLQGKAVGLEYSPSPYMVFGVKIHIVIFYWNIVKLKGFLFG